MIKAILRAAERDWKWLEKAPVIKIPAVRNKRVRWLEKEEAKRLIQNVQARTQSGFYLNREIFYQLFPQAILGRPLQK